ncbi:BON domain-containing protein [Vibrio sp. ZSDZ65]|uniref:BON domain-containing protein n=1 Tax=Vibrio qingdaonensis TaxID=2829491 RepID=A0A9X3CKP4_9VIBR|nr:BON domain-containing protein [Vibrio qingdaonensis]MCW8345209.1 BON domain-containing protein [Vibrio qingdaonensis]
MKSNAMKIFKTVALLAMSLALSGCAGLFEVTDTRSAKELWNDSALESEVAGMTNKAPFVGQVRVVASSQRGTVVLMGQAQTEALRNTLEARVSALDGVKRVYNQVRINSPLGFTQMSNDSWLTTKVKSALLTDDRLNGVKIKVITENKEVFLLGYVSKEHADVATEIARKISGVSQVIRAFQFSETQEKLNTEAEVEPKKELNKQQSVNSAPVTTEEEAMRPIIEEPAPFVEVEG